MRSISVQVFMVAAALAAGLWVYGFPHDMSIRAELPGIAETASTEFRRFFVWLPDIYQRFPAVVIGLAGLVVLPLLALAGLIVRAIARMRHRHRKGRLPGVKPESATPDHSTQAHYCGPAWIKILNPHKSLANPPAAAPAPAKVVLRGEMLRIGREQDNDVCLDDPSVHRYHAMIQHTPDDEFVIADLSGRDGNGLWVNGMRMQNGALRHGDDIRLGKMRLLFGIGEPQGYSGLIDGSPV